MTTSPSAIAAVAALALAAAAATPARAADAFNFTVNSAASTVSYTGNASAPFTGTMTGDTTATPPTRLKHGTLIFITVQCGTFTATTNENIIISGAIAASGSNSNIHPTGTFQFAINPAANTAAVNALSLNLLGSSTATIAANLTNFRYETFCAVDPSCSVPFITAIPSLPLGNVSITSLTAMQTPGVATGTLTANGANTWNFSVPMTADITSTATFSGAPLPITPQTVPLVLAGTITVTGNTATLTSTINLDLAPPANTTPTDLPPAPFTTPAGLPLVCAGMNLTLGLTVTSSTFTATSAANLTAPGTRIICPCDWNQTGYVSVQDVFDFLTSYFSNAGDFNHDSATTVQDIFDFLTCYFGVPFGC